MLSNVNCAKTTQSFNSLRDMKIFSIHSSSLHHGLLFSAPRLVFVSGVNVSCKQELVTADLWLVIGSQSWPLIGWAPDSLTCSEDGDNYNYRRATCSRKCCSGSVLCSICQLQTAAAGCRELQEIYDVPFTNSVLRNPASKGQARNMFLISMPVYFLYKQIKQMKNA